MIRLYSITFTFVVAMMLAGCQNDKTTSPSKTPPSTSNRGDHDHDHGDDHADHDHKDADHDHEGGHGDEGPMRELGNATAGAWTVSASVSDSDLTPGGETVVECEVTGGSGTISAVRCWIGTKDAKGAIKAIAAVEDSADPSHRHVHVEVPKPLEEGSQLWVEVEDNAGAKHAAGFDLKR